MSLKHWQFSTDKSTHQG